MTLLLPSHGFNTDVLVDGQVISQYFNEMSPSFSRDKAEVSAFKQLFKSYVMGLVDGTVAVAGMYDPNIDNQLQAYFQQLGNADHSWFHAPLGAQGASAFGNPAKSMIGALDKYEPKSALASANLITASIQLDQYGGGVDTGLILSPWVTQSAGGTGSSVNNSAGATTNGAVLIVQASNDTTSLVVNLQDSADGSTFANVTGYTISPTNTTAAAYRYPAAGTTPSGTIRQYTRITWTGTGTFLAMLSRK